MIATTINATNVENITINNYVICNFEDMPVDSNEETTSFSNERSRSTETVTQRDKVSNVQFVIAWTRGHRVGIDEIVNELSLGRAWVYYRYLRLLADGVPLGAPVFGPPWAESDVVGLTAHIRATGQND